MTKEHAVLAVCDARKGLLYDASFDDNGHLHLACMEQISSRWHNFHEHGRPDALGRGPSANAAQHFADTAQEPEEMDRRFARDLAAKFRDARVFSSLQPIVIFAAPRMLGALRHELSNDAGFMLRRGELTRLRPSELASHPLVRAVARTLFHTALIALPATPTSEETLP
ncbi:MAG: host attachment protein [Limnohabitans sp.]|jgi:protein required for attachment to host cells|nr:host attachment protein [Limnohabitans sp.]